MPHEGTPPQETEKLRKAPPHTPLSPQQPEAPQEPPSQSSPEPLGCGEAVSLHDELPTVTPHRVQYKGLSP